MNSELPMSALFSAFHMHRLVLTGIPSAKFCCYSHFTDDEATQIKKLLDGGADFENVAS